LRSERRDGFHDQADPSGHFVGCRGPVNASRQGGAPKAQGSRPEGSGNKKLK
jgi:hypothetical protein